MCTSQAVPLFPSTQGPNLSAISSHSPHSIPPLLAYQTPNSSLRFSHHLYHHTTTTNGYRPHSPHRLPSPNLLHCAPLPLLLLLASPATSLPRHLEEVAGGSRGHQEGRGRPQGHLPGRGCRDPHVGGQRSDNCER